MGQRGWLLISPGIQWIVMFSFKWGLRCQWVFDPVFFLFLIAALLWPSPTTQSYHALQSWPHEPKSGLVWTSPRSQDCAHVWVCGCAPQGRAQCSRPVCVQLLHHFLALNASQLPHDPEQLIAFFFFLNIILAQGLWSLSFFKFRSCCLGYSKSVPRNTQLFI